MRVVLRFAFLAALAAALPATARAEDATDLAKKLANPVASLISVPFQFNYDDGLGATNGGHRWLVNFQPVIPISLGEDWNLISRTIIPFIANDNVVPSTSPSGVGNITQSFFFSPKAPTRGGLIWGVGPVLVLPTSTDTQFGPDQFAAGITGVVLRQTGPWTIGVLANQVWDVGGGSTNDINNTYLQPLVSYTTHKAWTFTLNSESNYDWVSDQASVPINFMVSKVAKLGGRQPISIGGGIRYWANPAPNGPEGWGARLIVTFLYPKG